MEERGNERGKMEERGKERGKMEERGKERGRGRRVKRSTEETKATEGICHSLVFCPPSW